MMDSQGIATTPDLPASVLCGAATGSAAVSFSYSVENPYAVTMTVTSRGAAPVEWVFGRHLLAAGIHGGFGSGDVIVAPAPEGPNLLIGLYGGYFAVVGVRCDDVVTFLDRTYKLIPLGHENPYVDVDGFLDQVLPG
jgi:hypothetical protein